MIFNYFDLVIESLIKQKIPSKIIQFVCITNKLAHWPMGTMTNFTWFVTTNEQLIKSVMLRLRGHGDQSVDTKTTFSQHRSAKQGFG